MVRLISNRNLVVESGFLKVCIGYVDAYFVVFVKQRNWYKTLIVFGDRVIAFSKAFARRLNKSVIL